MFTPVQNITRIHPCTHAPGSKVPVVHRCRLRACGGLFVPGLQVIQVQQLSLHASNFGATGLKNIPIGVVFAPTERNKANMLLSHAYDLIWMEFGRRNDDSPIIYQRQTGTQSGFHLLTTKIDLDSGPLNNRWVWVHLGVVSERERQACDLRKLLGDVLCDILLHVVRILAP